MAEDDDEEAFGDFTFATSSSFSHPPQIVTNALTSSSKKDAEEDDDDEWGDFVTPKSDSAASQLPWSGMKSGGFGDSVTDRVVSDRVMEKGKGVRARGALPLSIFGEEEGEGSEEEEEKGSGGGFGGAESFGGKKGSDLGGLGISDLLASLYDQGGGGDGKMEDGNFVNRRENGLSKEFDVLDSRSNGYVKGVSSSAGVNGQRMGSNESLFNFSVMNSGSDGFSSSAKAFNQGEVVRVENGRRTKSDESVFSFMMMSSGSDVFSFGGKPSIAAASVNTENGWSKSTYEWDFNLNTSETGNNLGSVGRNFEVNGSRLGTDELNKSSSSEDNDDDGWEFQGNTNVTKELEDDRQWETTSTNKSESDPNVLLINSSKEDETQGEWEFQDLAAPTAKDDSNEIWDFQGNGISTAKENDDGVWEFQGVAVPTAKEKHNSEWGFVGNSNTVVEEEEDDGWEFQVAPVDQNPKQEWNTGMQGFGAQGATLRSDTQVAGLQHEIPHITNFMPKPNFGDDNLTGISAPSGTNFGFESFVSNIVPQNGSFIDSVSEGNRCEIENQSSSAAFNGSADADDSYWDYKDSFPETNLKNEVNKADGDQKGALPSSLFSDEPLDSNESLNQDVFSFNPSKSRSNGFTNVDPSASLSDLILNLYNQPEKKSYVESPQQTVTDSSDAIQTVNDSTSSNDEDDFDGTWDFKDASLSSIADDQSSFQVHHSSNTISKMENLVDFYCKLKDQSTLAAICHLSSLKEAKSIAEHAKDSEVEALDEKIQDALEELNKANIVLEDALENFTPDNCLKEFHQVLSEPKFQMLESEYGMSRRLSAAEKDLKAAIELVEHAGLILKVLSMGSPEQQSSYVCAWTEILFVCAQELQHGASIWHRAVEKSVTSQILSQTKGKKFVHALGEIFRVVLILEAASKAYRPWILSNSTEGDSIITLLNECSTLWSISGLSDALKDISDPADSECAGEIRALLESIGHVHEHSVPHELGVPNNTSLRQQDSACGLSLLHGAMFPDVKMVVWNGEQFFLPLANLWANLISSDPPKLPRIHAG